MYTNIKLPGHQQLLCMFISVSQNMNPNNTCMRYGHMADTSSLFFYYVISVCAYIYKLISQPAQRVFMKLQPVPAYSWKSLFVWE